MPDRTRPALQTIDDETQLKMKKRASKIDPDVLAMQAFQLLEQAKPHQALALYERGMKAHDFNASFYVNALYALNMANLARPLPRAHTRRVLDHIMSRRRLHADTYWNAACTCVDLDDIDRCFEYLRIAKRRGVDMKKCLADEAFEPLAADPRFIALKRAGK